MSNNNPFANNPFADAMNQWSENVAKALGNCPFSPSSNQAPDLQKIAEDQRKLASSIVEAQKVVADNIRSAAERQVKQIQENINEALRAAKESLSAKNPEESTNRQAELVKELTQSNIANATKIAEDSAKANQKAIDLVNKQMSEYLNELAASVSGNKKKSGKKQAEAA